MGISLSDVEKVSLLARLQLDRSELEKMTEQLGQIVEYVDQLGQVDTEGVQPMAHAVEVHNVMAEDSVAPSLDREVALSGAPRHNDRGYLVPAVLGD